MKFAKGSLKFPVLALFFMAASAALLAQQATPGLADRSVLAGASGKNFHATPHDLTNGNAHSRFGIHGIDSIPNFNGQFFDRRRYHAAWAAPRGPEIDHR